MSDSSTWLVCIEVKRVQTFLFSVPKLKAMLGANAMIGETIRNELFELAKVKGAVLPNVIQNPFQPETSSQLVVVQPDPLDNPMYQDNPTVNYGAGVFSRDGGHFRAIFDSDTKAKKFASGTQELLATALPGLRCEIRLGQWSEGKHDWLYEEVSADDSQSLFRPVQFATCELSGQGTATQELELAGGKKRVSLAVRKQLEKGGARQGCQTFDMVGLLQDKWPYTSGDHQDGLVPPLPPADLQDIAGGPGCYLALVHLDGNSIGSRSTTYQDGTATKTDTLQSWFDKEAKIEKLFHSMRSSVRIAVTAALQSVFPEADAALYKHRPYQVLMLGGDDLLLVCRAEKALPFVVDYARALSSRKLADEKPLGVGAGVVICQPSMPIHRVHALAEELASSAKRLSRGCNDPSRSVIDWMVLSQSTIASIEHHRVNHEIVHYLVNGVEQKLILSRKPYFVLNQPKEPQVGRPEPLSSLESMLDAVQKIGNRAARSQLKNLPEAFRQGRYAAKFAFEDLPDQTRAALQSVGIDQPWTVLPNGNDTRITRTLDLIEILEIPRLGRNKPFANPSQGRPVIEEEPVPGTVVPRG